VATSFLRSISARSTHTVGDARTALRSTAVRVV